MSAKDANLPTTPVIPELGTCLFRFKLLEEELNELKDAFFADSLTGVADAIGDILYIAIGAAVECGINIEPVFDEIHRSNMTKLIGGVKLRSDGKILKGPKYEPPELLPIIARQILPKDYQSFMAREGKPTEKTGWVGMDSDGA